MGVRAVTTVIELARGPVRRFYGHWASPEYQIPHLADFVTWADQTRQPLDHRQLPPLRHRPPRDSARRRRHRRFRRRVRRGPGLPLPPHPGRRGPLAQTRRARHAPVPGHPHRHRAAGPVRHGCPHVRPSRSPRHGLRTTHRRHVTARGRPRRLAASRRRLPAPWPNHRDPRGGSQPGRPIHPCRAGGTPPIAHGRRCARPGPPRPHSRRCTCPSTWTTPPTGCYDPTVPCRSGSLSAAPRSTQPSPRPQHPKEKHREPRPRRESIGRCRRLRRRRLPGLAVRRRRR